MSCEPPSVFVIPDESFVEEEDAASQRRAEEARESDHKMLGYVGAGVLGGLVLACDFQSYSLTTMFLSRRFPSGAMLLPHPIARREGQSAKCATKRL